jgi:hypothetical protein
VMSTFATLLVIPSIFAVVMGRKQFHSPSIYPDDPESSHYDPRVFAEETAPDGTPGGPDESLGSNDNVVNFLRELLDEGRSKRNDASPRYTVDDLRAALGLSRSGSAGLTVSGVGAHPSEQPASPGIRQASGDGHAPDAPLNGPASEPPTHGEP